MPEGDTIYRTAVRLRAAMEGKRIQAARGRDPALATSPLCGRQVTAIEARGKHLLMHTSGEQTIHSHMGMTGSWHLYARGQAWRKPAKWAALVLEMQPGGKSERTSQRDQVPEPTVIVCFSPKTLELLSATGLRRHPYLGRLGPDILATGFESAAIVPRFRVHNHVPIGEAVMNQTILCGIGNIYKSEVLFLCGIDPLCRVAGLSDQQLTELVTRARNLMRRNLGGHLRQTRFTGDGSRFWAYGRGGRRCLKCGHPIRTRRQGNLGRITFWCPQCQPAQDRTKVSSSHLSSCRP
jgi:endonuclease-8